MAENDKFLNGEGLAYYDSVQKDRINELQEKVDKINDYFEPPQDENAKSEKVYAKNSRDLLHELSAGASFTKIAFIYDLPPMGIATYDVSLNSDKSVLGWRDEDTCYISGLGNDIYITDCTELFSSVAYLLTDITFDNFHTEETTSFNGMFSNCGKLTELDLSGFQIDSLTDASKMFYGCQRLTTIYAHKWNEIKPTGVESADMFSTCMALPNFSWISFDWSKANYNGGYFTDPLLNPNVGSGSSGSVNNQLGLIDRLERVEGLIGKIDSNQITTNKNNISDLTITVENKVDKVSGKDLVSTSDISQITTNKNNISNLTTTVGNKANQSDLNNTNTRVSTLETQMGNVATKLESLI